MYAKPRATYVRGVKPPILNKTTPGALVLGRVLRSSVGSTLNIGPPLVVPGIYSLFVYLLLLPL
jgi:hypothetical protein